MAWDDFRGASQALDHALRALHRHEAEDSPVSWDRAGATTSLGRSDAALQVKREQWTRLTRAQRARAARRAAEGGS